MQEGLHGRTICSWLSKCYYEVRGGEVQNVEANSLCIIKCGVLGLFKKTPKKRELKI